MNNSTEKMYTDLNLIRNKISNFEKDLLVEKTKLFIELKKEENKILLQIINNNNKMIENLKETNLDIWTQLHTLNNRE